MQTVQAYEASQHRAALATATLDADIAARLATSSISIEECDGARASIRQARQYLSTVLTGAVLVIPTAASPATPAGATTDAAEAARNATRRLTCIASLAGAPAISLPLLTVSTSTGAAPVGLCLVSAPGTDRQLLQLADQLSSVDVTAQRLRLNCTS